MLTEPDDNNPVYCARSHYYIITPKPMRRSAVQQTLILYATDLGSLLESDTTSFN